ncbi:MAG: SDR family NAD(P)-dependent oxidoreductase [Gemmatimonadota bacterium]
MILEGRTVIITGAGRGIGGGIADAVAEAGAAVAALDLDGAAAAATARRIEERGGRSLGLEADVTDLDAVREALDRTAGALGPVDGLVNNAGVIRMAPAAEISDGDWTAQFEVNVRALFLCSRLAAARMRESGVGGSIVNVASNAGKVGYPNMAAYNASKAAVISLTRSLAAEWAADGINVNAVCPGGVDTPMLTDVARWIAARTGVDPEELRSTMVPAQLGRHVQPLEIGRVVAFLLSGHATAIRGQAINADAGDTPY